MQFKAGTNENERGQARSLLGANLTEAIHTATMQREGQGVLERLTLGMGAGADLDAAIAALSRNPNVAFAERNYIVRPAAVSNDLYYTNGSLWGMYGDDNPSVAGPAGTTNPYGSQAEKAWNDGITGSRTVVVGIIDEGIQITHPDLAANIWVNPYETSNGIDDDGNGYIDDINGWDFVHNDKSVYDVGEDAHGTHVAGTIGGLGGNGTGVAGVNWAVSMISAKFLGPGGGMLSDAVKAVDYLTDLKIRHGINLVASNNSWGGGNYSQALHDAIIRMAKADILFVAAAGNATSNNDTLASYPSNYNTTLGTSTQTAASFDGVIAVAAINSSGALSSFSSYGASTVDLGAPGEGVMSSVPTDSYAIYNGTSMATPHVTGAAALYASAQPAKISAAAIREALLTSTTATASLNGKTATGGRLNVAGALQRSAFLALDRDTYSLPGTVALSVNDPAGNRNASAAESVVVTVTSGLEATPESVTLYETGSNTGRFSGSINLNPSASGAIAGDNILQAADGNTITARYTLANLSSTQSATARVDATAPLMTGVVATPLARSSEIRWTTNEASSTEVVYGTTPTTLAGTYSAGGMLSQHIALLTGLTPSTTYYYQVRSRDAVGNLTTDGMVRSFQTLPPASILLVDDDQGASFEQFYIAALNANGYTYDLWDAFSRGNTPSSQDLQAYSLVIWNTGYDYTAATAGLSLGEQDAISGYLNAGGRMFLSGQDILYKGVTTSFLNNYLKVASFAQDQANSAHTETGITGNPISNGQSLSVNASTAGYPSLYVDAITPTAEASGIFLHGNSIAPSPYAAISYLNPAPGGFGIVFSTFPFEAVSTSAADPNNQKVLLKRILDFLGGNTSLPPGINVSAPTPSAATSEAGAAVSVTVSLAAAPKDTVTIPVSSSNPNEGLISISSLLFTPANWATAQTVTVTGVNDWVDDGDIPYQLILGTAISTDTAYNGLDPTDVALRNIDDDTAGLTRGALSGSTTSESGGAVTFTVRLNSEPRGPVTLNISSNDLTEGSVIPGGSPRTLSFDPTNWNINQTVTITGVDDTIVDGNINYIAALAPTASSDPLYANIDLADIPLSNLDNDQAPTKFFVVNDGSPDRTYEYDTAGASIENYSLNSLNTAPRGAATTATGSTIWVVDANRNVYIYNDAGVLQGSWSLGTVATNASLQGIATDGTHIWIVDAQADRVYYYANGASRRNGTQTATGSFALHTNNTSPTDIVFGTSGSTGTLWVVNNASTGTDRVYRYTLGTNNLVSGTATNWALNSANSSPTGITLDPSNASLDLWVVDNGTDRVYRYANARTLTSPTLTSSFPLATAAGNTNPQGLADPFTGAAPVPTDASGEGTDPEASRKLARWEAAGAWPHGSADATLPARASAGAFPGELGASRPRSRRDVGPGRTPLAWEGFQRWSRRDAELTLEGLLRGWRSRSGR